MATNIPEDQESPASRRKDAVRVVQVDAASSSRDPKPMPLYSSAVRAGFPSPADDHIESHLDINSYLVKNPDATFFVRVSGVSMINAGIYENDILVVDKSITPTHNKIVIVAIDGELTVKRLHKTERETLLMPENSTFKPIKINEESDVVVWGVVIGLIRHV